MIKMRNHATKKWWQREPFVSIIAAVSASIVTFFLTYSFSEKSIKDGVVQAISQRFSFVDASMSYEKAIEELDIHIRNLKIEIQDLSQEIIAQKEQLEEKYDVQFYSPAFIKDGLRLKEEIYNSILFVDEKYYIDIERIELLTDKKIYFDEKQNVLAEGQALSSGAFITKVDVFQSNILYEGSHCKIYRSTDGERFSMAGENYTEGAVLSTDATWDNNAYGLFNLQGKYTSLLFTIGCMDNAQRIDVTMDIYLDGELAHTYELSSDVPSYNIEIPLNYANSMKLELRGGGAFDTFFYGITYAVLTI